MCSSDLTLHLRRAFELKSTERSDLRILRPDGSSFPALLASVVPPKRNICLTTIVDISDKRRTEEELREAVARFQQLTDQIDDVFLRLRT